VIYVGIDDTDTLETPGTNQLARVLAGGVADKFRCLLIVRHQLFFDPRVPYTSHNGSASILLEPLGEPDMRGLTETLRQCMLERFNPGSDPGLCVTEFVPPEVITFGQRCQGAIVSQAEARALAASQGIYLEGLGGTQDGVIGALAAVGLAATGHDGRVVHMASAPHDLSGNQEIAVLERRGVEVRKIDSGELVTCGMVDVGKKLRPNFRNHRVVLYVTPAPVDRSNDHWQAVRLP
jgi:hypothetical protein